MPAPPESHWARGSSPNPLEVSTTTANARPAAPCQNDGSATPSQVAVWALVQFVATQFQLMQSNSKKYNLPERLGAELFFRIVLGLEHQHADAPHPLPLLRARRERPRHRRAAAQSDETAPREIEHGEQSSAKSHGDNRLSHRNQAPPLASRGDLDAIRNEREHRPCPME